MAEERKDDQPVVANPHYAGAYREAWEQARATGVCPFCVPEFQSRLVAYSGNWIAVPADYPAVDREKGHPAAHLLLISVSHEDSREQRTPSDWTDIGNLVAILRTKPGLGSGCLFMRFGDPDVAGTTVLHPHVHFAVPRRNEKGAIVPVDFAAG